MSAGDLAVSLVAELTARGETLATAESLTGGGLGVAVTAVAGASAAYRGGVIAYATEVKEQVLGVPAEVIAAHGVISAECAAAMARGVRELLGADWALATTGVAGPDSAEGHPAGTVYVGLAGPSIPAEPEGTGEPGARLLRLAGTREEIRAETTRLALGWLAESLGSGREESRLG